MLAAGFSERAIDYRIAVGRLHRSIQGSTQSEHTALRPGARYMAAVLAVGDDAVLSHKAAAARLGLRPSPSGPIDVTVPRGGGRRHKGLAVHVTRSLPDSEVTKVENIPCTTWARTLIDFAGVVTSASWD